VRSVVVTSATLTASGSFSLVQGDLGAESARVVEVESPFDWVKNALFVCPPGLPMPNEAAWQAQAIERLVDAIHASKGRTLGLFTSWRVLEAAKEGLRSLRLPYELLFQGDAPRSQLVQRFRDERSSCLFGVASFWEGVDVPGDALSCVVIDKIPFESPDDPIADLLASRRRDYFKKYALPRAVIAFRQGVGRLLRSKTDRGVIVCLDPRLTTKGYGAAFLRSLPDGTPVLRGSDWAARVAEFLG
jgi:ATP-dependent DNA helicase DinG